MPNTALTVVALLLAWAAGIAFAWLTFRRRFIRLHDDLLNARSRTWHWRDRWLDAENRLTAARAALTALTTEHQAAAGAADFAWRLLDETETDVDVARNLCTCEAVAEYFNARPPRLSRRLREAHAGVAAHTTAIEADQ